MAPLLSYTCPGEAASLGSIARDLLSGRVPARLSSTDSDGRFAFRVEADHAYRLQVLSDVGVATQDVKSGANLLVALIGGVPLEGTVKDRDDHPIVGATVSILTVSGDLAFVVATDAAGKYSVPRAPDEPYVTACEHPDFVGAVDEDRTGHFVLSRPRRITGVVEGMQGGIPAQVSLEESRPPLMVGPDGRFTIEDLDWGKWELVARQGTLVAATTVDLTKTLVEDVRLQLEPQPVIEGAIKAAATGQGIPGATITVRSPAGVEEVKSDARGHFLAHAAPGLASVDVSAPQFRAPVESRQVQAKAGERIEMDFELKPAVPFRGRVVEAFAWRHLSSTNKRRRHVEVSVWSPECAKRTSACHADRLERS